MNKRSVGNKAEDKAAEFLERNGYQIIQRNYYTRFGEIDIIARDNNVLVFVEVKFRTNTSFGSPLESISVKKINSLCKAARIFLSHIETECRFDVIAILNNQIVHLKNAFEYPS